MRFRRFLIGVTFAACLPLAYACGLAMTKVTATEPTPTLYPKLQEGTVRVDVFDVPTTSVCSPKVPQRRDFCVDNLHHSMGQGLVGTLGKFMRPGTKDATYSAEYALIGFQQAPSATSGTSVRIAMRWKFTLKRIADGVSVIALDETTVAPQEVVRADLADEAVMGLVNQIFERIGAELGKQDLSGKPPEPPPAEPDAGVEDAAPPQVCVPNATQECVGPGACKGGQSCLPDGTGFTECDCGKKKKKPAGGAKAPAATAPAAPAPPPAEPTP
jgi:hypothetical protein